MLSLLAVKVPSVENSVIVAPVPPNDKLPKVSSFNPARLNDSTFRLAVPVACYYTK